MSHEKTTHLRPIGIHLLTPRNRVESEVTAGIVPRGPTLGFNAHSGEVMASPRVRAVYLGSAYGSSSGLTQLAIWPGDPQKADESLIPTPEETGLTALGQIARAFYSLHVKGRYQLLNDNLLDLSHLGFLHRTTIGTEENASAPETREYDGRRLRTRRHMQCPTGPKVVSDLYGYDGPVDRLSGMDFFSPGFHSGIEERRIPSSDSAHGGELISATKVWHAVTPSVYDETLYFFAMSASSTEKLDFMYQYLQSVIAEDVFATEEIEKILRRLGEPPPELMLKCDANVAQGRRILQAMMNSERQPPK